MRCCNTEGQFCTIMEWYDKNTYIIAYHSRRMKGENNMSYQMVNEELKIASCCLAELTLGQVQEFLKHWNDCEPIGTLTLFYDKDGTLVLNRDHKYYDDYLDIAERMMQLDLESAEEAARKAPESLKESMNVILTCMQREGDTGHDVDFGKRQILSGRSRNESAGRNSKQKTGIQSGLGYGGCLSLWFHPGQAV